LHIGRKDTRDNCVREFAMTQKGYSFSKRSQFARGTSQTKATKPRSSVTKGEFVYAVTAAESIILSSSFTGRKQKMTPSAAVTAQTKNDTFCSSDRTNEFTRNFRGTSMAGKVTRERWCPSILLDLTEHQSSDLGR